MARCTATAICEGDHRVIDVPGGGTTRAGGVDDIEEMASRRWLSTWSSR